MAIFWHIVALRLKGFCCVAGMLALAAGTARADLGPLPPPSELGLVFQESAGPFELEYSEDEETTESRLIIPAHLLSNSIDLGVRDDGFGGAGPLFGTHLWRTVLAGLLLSLAAASLLLVVRRRRVARAVLAAMMLGGGLFFAYDLGTARPAMADAPVPPDPDWPEPDITDGVLIEFTEQGDVIRFIRGTAGE